MGGFWDEGVTTDCVVVVEDKVWNTFVEDVILDNNVDEVDKVLAVVVAVNVEWDLDPNVGVVVFGTLDEDDNDVVAVETAVRLPKFAASPAKPIGLFAEVCVFPCVIVGWNEK